MIKNTEGFLLKASKHVVAMKVIAASLALLSASKAFSVEIDSSLKDAPESSSSYEMIIENPTDLFNRLEIQAASGIENDHSLMESIQDRPDLHNYVTGESIKLMERGDSDLSATFNDNMAGYNNWVDMRSPEQVMPGEAMYFKGELVGADSDICYVTHEQTADVSNDGFYLYNEENTVTIYPKHLTDFFLKSHETGHCSFFFEYQDDSDMGFYQYTSLKEVASDLGAVIDYMRVTGNNELYQDFLRPMRMSDPMDSTHKTAWALDEILKDIDPKVMDGRDAADVPKIVDVLLKKHMLAEDGKTIDMSKAASAAMDSEIRAGLAVGGKEGISNQATIDEYKQDMSDTLMGQINRFEAHMDQEDHQFHVENFEALRDFVNLPAPQVQGAASATMLDVSISKHSFAEHYLGR